MILPEVEEHPRRTMYDNEDAYLEGMVDSDGEEREIDEEDEEFCNNYLQEVNVEDDGLGIHSKKGMAAAKARGAVPEGGFAEDDDFNAEDAADAEYYAMLEREEDPDFETLKAKGLKYSNGEPEMEEYDLLGTLDHACALDYLDVATYFFDSANAIESFRPGFIQGMMAKVGDVESKKFDIIAAAVSQRRAASRIEDAMLRFQAIESTRCASIHQNPLPVTLHNQL